MSRLPLPTRVDGEERRHVGDMSVTRFDLHLLRFQAS